MQPEYGGLQIINYGKLNIKLFRLVANAMFSSFRVNQEDVVGGD